MVILRESQYLRHAQFGLGVVTQANASRTTVDFQDHGKKKFATELFDAQLLTGAPPPKPVSVKPRAKAAPVRGSFRK